MNALTNPQARCRGRSPIRIAAGLAAALLTLACSRSEAGAAEAAAPPEIVRVWPGAAPNTQDWRGPEAELDANLPGAGKVHIVTNVATPTLTVFRPAPARANGAAMLVAPGGAFRALAWDLEGTEVAQWLAARGITAFVLKYRVRPAGEAAAGAEPFEQWWRRTAPARELAVADAGQALRTIRASAGKYRLSGKRVGMIGFSAGAMTALGAAFGADPTARPDFLVSVYGAMAPDQEVGPGAPPLFVVAAQDDAQVPPAKSVALLERWSAAHAPAELHLYAAGGHGFGMRRRNLPLDQWPAALEAWLLSRGLATAGPAGTRR